MLRYREFVPFAPATPGVVRVNHNSPTCAGTSKSIRVERLSDGSITAKCFRCGAIGRDLRESGSLRVLKESLREVEQAAKDRPLGELVYDTTKWPVLAWQWVRQYGITEGEIKEYGLCYAVERRRVLLPIWWAGEKVGYQLRKIYDDDPGPKYDTRCRGGVGFMSFSPVINNEVVLVEDILSAIKVGRVARTIALLSTNITQAVRTYLSQFDRFHVWLDMDNPQVIRSAVKLLNTLDLFGKTHLITTMKDPKCYDESYIKEALYDA